MKKVFFYKDNMGDAINEDICRAIFHMDVKQVIKPSQCEALFIGSNLEKFLWDSIFEANYKIVMRFFPSIDIWGSGFIEQHDDLTHSILKRECKVHALRGKLTKRYMCSILRKPLDDVALGDPGILASELLDFLPKEKKYDFGIIPHYVDKSVQISSMINLSNSTIIDIQDTPRNVISKMKQCNYILSSSLHGMIVADSLNIPNVRLVISDDIIGGDFKYNDYYSSYEVEQNNKVDVRKVSIDKNNIDSYLSKYSIDRKSIEMMKERIYKSFPYD